MTSALDRGEWSVSRPGRALPPGERTPGTHCTGGWVGPRAGLDKECRGKILCLCRGSNPDRPVVQPVVRHYTAWANPAPCILLACWNQTCSQWENKRHHVSVSTVSFQSIIKSSDNQCESHLVAQFARVLLAVSYWRRVGERFSKLLKPLKPKREREIGRIDK
jgi:hypothetical protein